MLSYKRKKDKTANESNADNLIQKDYGRKVSKILSDYMIYILVMQPTMMSAVAGIGQIRFRDTCAEAEKFFNRRVLNRNDVAIGCEEILKVETKVKPVDVKGDRSKSA